MATVVNIAVIGFHITVLGWLLSPIIALLLPKILSCLGFDASQKLQELEIHIIPKIRSTLQAVDEARMLSWAKKEKPNGAVLDKMAGMLRHAQLEAEDILDLVDYHQIERKIIGEGSSWSSARAAAGCVASTCIARCNKSWLGIVRIIRGGSARLQQSSLCRFLAPSDSSRLGCLSRCFHFFNKSWLRIVRITRHGSARLQQSSLCRFLHRPNDVLPVVAAPSDDILPVDVSAPPSDEPLPVVAGDASSVESSDDEPITVTSAPPSDPLGRWLSCWCSSFDFFKNCCTSIFEAACFYRNWSYDWVGITNHQENATVLDSVLPAISRRNLKKRIERVESTVSEVKKSHLLDIASKSASNDIFNKNRRDIKSSSSKREVFGREELLGDIMQKILPETPPGDAPSSSSRTCYSVIGIYGVAGSGKTTLARYVLDHVKEYNGEHFDTLMCIHVSENFNVDDIFHDMLEDMTKNGHSNISSREELKKKLKQNLRSKRFFLVLDDLWVKDNNYMELMELLSPLNAGMKGSKILVTARIKDVVRAIGADEPIAISDLDEEQYFRMFMHYSLGRTGIHDEEIEVAGRKIAKKLHRSPIAAVTVAGQLRGKPIRFWKATAELDVLNGTMGALWWSYMQLDVDIRRCFEYCNIFPRRISLERDELVRLWIAQGFVKTSCTTDEMEDVAERYVEELVSCSFLQPFSDGSNSFTIHDLLHDLVDRVVGNACFRIDNARSQRGKGWTGDVPRDVRHLFVYYYDAELITEILQLENLRTLIISHVQREPLEEKIVESISKRLLKLRVLVIGFYLSESWPTATIPESVSQLKQLRYLCLHTDTSSLVTLPSAPTKLYHLQFLDFGWSAKLEFSTAGLINLRNLCSTRSKRLSNIGRLISLQTVPYFKVKNKQGYEIKQLRDLNKIRGRLEISGLENVESKEEALEADLVAKKQLTEMTLDWNGGSRKCSPEVEAEVLEALCPPVGLETLQIWGYRGSRYPDWMVCKQSGGPTDLKQLELFYWNQRGPAPELDAFVHLHSLGLGSCDWEALPSNMEYLTLLKVLKIRWCSNIQSLPTLPRSLEKFELDCCQLVALPSNMQYLTLLKELKISYCPNIQSLPTLPRSLEKIVLCGFNKFTESCETVGHPNWQKIKHVRTKEIY